MSLLDRAFVEDGTEHQASGDSATLTPTRDSDFVYGATLKANHDIQKAREELKRNVDPDALRSWVLAQFRKHPQGGCIKAAGDDWPESFPQLPTRRFLFYIYPSCQPHGLETRLEARLKWAFFDQALTVTVLLNPDGTPADVEDEEYLPAAQKWAKGIVFRQMNH